MLFISDHLHEQIYLVLSYANYYFTKERILKTGTVFSYFEPNKSSALIKACFRQEIKIYKSRCFLNYHIKQSLSKSLGPALVEAEVYLTVVRR